MPAIDFVSRVVSRRLHGFVFLVGGSLRLSFPLIGVQGRPEFLGSPIGRSCRIRPTPLALTPSTKGECVRMLRCLGARANSRRLKFALNSHV